VKYISCFKRRTVVNVYAAQALHAHILVWMQKRVKKPDGYRPLAPILREAPGSEQRQRPSGQKVDPLEKPQEDNLYHQVHVNRISCEMARPYIGDDLTGWDVEKLRIAGLARAIQTKLCLHTCSTRYCLLNRPSCRFLCFCCFVDVAVSRRLGSSSRGPILRTSGGTGTQSARLASAVSWKTTLGSTA